ncbi:TetR family transcriptional regulator [Kribbella amoyensis]|uniref:TetR family transcriptional regulator n=1 Tax=Kribbella amoyensis TaxID=996641 RepID=A0A561BXE8_9ACTN|nr:TetR/AcrR family transcriptional regulator [Kribbella amoyensis]TWD83564.1 TetR family transcriptional regulator [Kribbella amoyensis]
MSPVKKVDGRAEKSRLTRARILDAAAELFVRDGYGATSLQDIAGAAGVAVQTIYYGFGNKQTVLKQVVDRTIAGDDEPVATLDRPWFQEVLATGTAAEHVRRHVQGTQAVLERVAPITKMLEAAGASDAGIANLWPHEQDPRLTVQRAAAESLLGKPGARSDLTTERAADILFGLLSTEFYLLMVGDRGWDPKDWAAWVTDLLLPQLCTPPFS